MRYFIELAYHGGRYKGWQIQHQTLTVQGTLEQALGTILRQPTPVVGSGRTDTGVHAEQQFAHFDTDASLDCTKLTYQLNRLLPHDIAIRRIVSVPQDAHARFDATARRYEYRISRIKNPFRPDMVYHYEIPLDVEAMNLAAKYLLNYTDFQSFSLVNTQVKTFRCAIVQAHWEAQPNALSFHIKADRFLRGMVRAIVGTLLEIGRGTLPVEAFEEIILAKDRCRAKRAVPPEGLFLVEVSYPQNIIKI